MLLLCCIIINWYNTIYNALTHVMLPNPCIFYLNIGFSIYYRILIGLQPSSCPSLVKPDPVLKTKIWSVVVEAWILWLPDCGYVIPKGKQTFQKMSYGKCDGKYMIWQYSLSWQAERTAYIYIFPKMSYSCHLTDISMSKIQRSVW